MFNCRWIANISLAALLVVSAGQARAEDQHVVSLTCRGMTVQKAISILQQPVESSGGSGWLWGLSVIFGLGIALGAMTLPSISCPPGQYLSVFRFCYIASNDRFPVIDKRWMKDVADVAGVVVALTLIRWRRLVFVTAPIAGAVWLVGSVDFLVRRIVQA